jgi:hypothetical protein
MNLFHTFAAHCIIRFHTGKVLFIGVRNIFCLLCTLAKKRQIDTPTHTCFKNWSGSPNAMEPDIIVEGFQQSLPVHGAKYLYSFNRFVRTSATMGLMKRKLIYNFSTFGFYNVVILKFHLVDNKLLSNIINIFVFINYKYRYYAGQKILAVIVCQFKKKICNPYFIVIMITVLIMNVIFWVVNFKTQNYFVISTTQNVYLRLSMYDSSNFVHSCRIFGMSELQTV